MGNCLVTKLKGSVDNSNLPLLNAVVLEIQEVASPTNESQWFNFLSGIGSSGSIDAEIIGDGHFIQGSSYAGGTDIGKVLTGVTDMSVSPWFYFSNGNYKVVIRGKYDINTLSAVSCIKAVDLDEFVYSQIIQFNTRGGKVKGNIAALRNVNSISLSLVTNPEVYGDLKDVMTAARTNISCYDSSNGEGKIAGNLTDVLASKDTITMFDVTGNAGVTGDIAVLGQCTNLTDLYCFCGCSTYGTIEGLVAAFRANGRTQGSITTQFYDNFGKCSVTFNGQPIPSTFKNKPLSWTADTITCNDVTINA